ncbi:MAG TPA: M28 family metallopeptidase [Solirubrobacteraceae bacterium]|nr:M28 family metallopeptidase [Solirubrobacteraceae bacterium]
MRAALVIALSAAVLLGCGGSSSSATQPGTQPVTQPARSAERADRFDGSRAFSLLRAQVEMGPRPAGSAKARELARWLRARLPNGRFERVDGGLINVVGHIRGKRPAVLVGAHYDTKDIPGFVGAEDGAGGTAAVLELARALKAMRRPAGAPEIRFVLFDGEECPDDTREFYSCGLRGSRDYARRHARELRAVVILDFIAQKDLSIPRDRSSDRRLWARLRAAARRVGSGRVFPDRVQPVVLDDHTPFLRRGIPAIDLIDFDFPCWHQVCDDMTAVSERSLDLSGEAVLELLRTWR